MKVFLAVSITTLLFLASVQQAEPQVNTGDDPNVVTQDQRVSLLFKGATIAPLAPGNDDFFVGYLAVDDAGRIVAVAPGEPPATLADATVVDATGKIIIPGFITGHNHLWQSAFRGWAPDGELYPWLETLHRSGRFFLEKGDYYAFTLHGALDQLSHGVTTSYNHSHTVGTADRLQYLEQFEAEVDAGQHFVFSYIMDHSNGPEAATNDLDAFIERAGSLPAPNPSLEVSIYGSGIWSGEENFQLEVALAKERGLTSQIHFLESSVTNENGRNEHEEFVRLVELDLLWPGLSFAHFIHTDEAMLESTANYGTAMIWNPLSNGRLASGLADIVNARKLGVRIGMGLDGQASGDISDPFENMRMGLYAIRMKYQSAKVLTPIDVLRMHTIEGAEVIGVADQVGSLEPGKWADFLIVDSRHPATGPVTNLYASLVFSFSSANVESVWVAGRKLVERGRILHIDFDAVKDDVARRVAEVKERQMESSR
ncbi:MAG: amidohydrolase family protein [Pseudomonadota bacterium]|nr:amidohydrolase family protein [Pseudomonadota bacterium]